MRCPNSVITSSSVFPEPQTMTPIWSSVDAALVHTRLHIFLHSPPKLYKCYQDSLSIGDFVFANSVGQDYSRPSVTSCIRPCLCCLVQGAPTETSIPKPAWPHCHALNRHITESSLAISCAHGYTEEYIERSTKSVHLTSFTK